MADDAKSSFHRSQTGWIAATIAALGIVAWYGISNTAQGGGGPPLAITPDFVHRGAVGLLNVSQNIGALTGTPVACTDPVITTINMIIEPPPTTSKILCNATYPGASVTVGTVDHYYSFYTTAVSGTPALNGWVAYFNPSAQNGQGGLLFEPVGQ